MKKLLITMLTLAASHGAVYALPVGNPSEASLMYDGLLWDGGASVDVCDPCASWCDAFSLRLGFYGDYVFDRNMQAEIVADSSTVAPIQTVGINTNAAFLAFNMWDRLDIFGTLGSSNLNIKGGCNILSYTVATAPTTSIIGTAPATPTAPTTPAGFVGSQQKYSTVEYQSTNEFSWSVGLRGTIWECGSVAIGAEAQYFAFSPKTDFVMIAPVDTAYRLGKAETSLAGQALQPAAITTDGLHYQEWQIGVGLSYRINMLTPYAGIKWAAATLEPKGFLMAVDLDGTNAPDTVTVVNQNAINVSLYSKNTNVQAFGYVVGVTLVDCDKAIVGVEGRFGDERALAVTGQFRF